jgi:hypothetical protein
MEWSTDMRAILLGLAVMWGCVAGARVAWAEGDACCPKKAEPTAEQAHQIPTPPAHPLFDRFKALVGRWEGTMTNTGGQPTPVAITYKLTAGGSALIETFSPDTPMEMVSVYFLDGDQLKMTHFCVTQNQPTLIARAGKDADTIELRFASATNMPDPNAMHMRNATYEFVAADHIRMHGEGYLDGQPMPQSCGVMELHRVSASVTAPAPGSAGGSAVAPANAPAAEKSAG